MYKIAVYYPFTGDFALDEVADKIAGTTNEASGAGITNIESGGGLGERDLEYAFETYDAAAEAFRRFEDDERFDVEILTPPD